MDCLNLAVLSFFIYQSRLHKLHPMTYKDQLLDPRWQKKRLEILDRDEFRCQYCGCTTKTLHVHHFAYKKGGFLWDVDNTALCALCCECHEIGHLKNLTSLEDEIISTLHLNGQINCGTDPVLNSIIQEINSIILAHKGKSNVKKKVY